MLRKNNLGIRIQQEKSYNTYELIFMGFEKVLNMQASGNIPVTQKVVLKTCLFCLLLQSMYEQKRKAMKT